MPERDVDRAGRHGLPTLHVLATDDVASASGWVDLASRVLRSCGPAVAIHLRLRLVSTRSLYERAVALSRVGDEDGGWCVVNGRGDVALAAGAQAVQLGSTAPPVRRVIPWVGERLRIGVSVHDPREAVRAARNGANFLVLGTIYPTPSHPGRPGAGPAWISECRAALDAADLREVGVVAIGGIDASRVREVREAGADGVAVIRAVWEAPDPASAAMRLADLANRENP